MPKFEDSQKEIHQGVEPLVHHPPSKQQKQQQRQQQQQKDQSLKRHDESTNGPRPQLPIHAIKHHSPAQPFKKVHSARSPQLMQLSSKRRLHDEEKQAFYGAKEASKNSDGYRCSRSTVYASPTTNDHESLQTQIHPFKVPADVFPSHIIHETSLVVEEGRIQQPRRKTLQQRTDVANMVLGLDDEKIKAKEEEKHLKTMSKVSRPAKNNNTMQGWDKNQGQQEQQLFINEIPVQKEPSRIPHEPSLLVQEWEGRYSRRSTLQRRMDIANMILALDNEEKFSEPSPSHVVGNLCTQGHSEEPSPPRLKTSFEPPPNVVPGEHERTLRHLNNPLAMLEELEKLKAQERRLKQSDSKTEKHQDYDLLIDSKRRHTHHRLYRHHQNRRSQKQNPEYAYVPSDENEKACDDEFDYQQSILYHQSRSSFGEDYCDEDHKSEELRPGAFAVSLGNTKARTKHLDSNISDTTTLSIVEISTAATSEINHCGYPNIDDTNGKELDFDEDIEAESNAEGRMKRISIIGLLMVLLAVAVVAIAVPLCLPSKERRREDIIELLLLSDDIDENRMEQGTIQSMALDFIVQNDTRFSTLSNPDKLRQRYALAVFFFSTGGYSIWPEDYNWFGTDLLDECEEDWKGVECDDDDKVVALDIEGKLNHISLTGSLPTELSILTTLYRIRIRENIDCFPDHRIPSFLYRMTQLGSLSLPWNDLTGSIPSSLAQLSNLECLELHDNNFKGSIPRKLYQSSFPNLTKFKVNVNELTGDIEDIINGLNILTNLNYLDFRTNKLTGTIPSTIGLMTSLEYFYIDNNPRSSGTIPSEMGQLTALVDCGFQTTSIQGTIPSNVCSLRSLSLHTLGCSIKSCTTPPMCCSITIECETGNDGENKTFSGRRRRGSSLFFNQT